LKTSQIMFKVSASASQYPAASTHTEASLTGCS